MRFHADGPGIPGELLEARDRGDVVFFCGAGVSKPAGLPSFPELAKQVMKALGTGASAPSRVRFEQLDGAQNLDRVFNLLQQEYRRDEVDEAVNRILRTPPRASTEAHATILRLSRNAVGRARVVTTNFDHLFERADKSLTMHIAPGLPDIRSVGSFEGLVYLHGRRSNPGSSGGGSGKGRILSSSDFGRAYLADGWATRFVRELLQNYFIVLVGYSASDPPVRYLLEGLQSRRESQSSTMYAFDSGEFDDVVDRWRGLGVQACHTEHRLIPNTRHCGTRSALGLFGLMMSTTGVGRSWHSPNTARHSLSRFSVDKLQHWFEPPKGRRISRSRLRRPLPNGYVYSIGRSATPGHSEEWGKMIPTRCRSMGSTMILHAQMRKKRTARITNPAVST